MRAVHTKGGWGCGGCGGCGGGGGVQAQTSPARGSNLGSSVLNSDAVTTLATFAVTCISIAQIVIIACIINFTIRGYTFPGNVFGFMTPPSKRFSDFSITMCNF